ncbi:hypothetical protein NONI108955_11090 [Nocardia ninae]|uniref:Uncharacterized protein n=1 Tax=Nocardia ninae NBRC 108245 TaxID=1210091 RepID=A0A511MPS2_9NOCA|nr:hypothetical protein [Nocardia ninae]GEM41956.1 hypothetical protein NN4_64750 [Nocardia ninae NBRC 108245]
MITQDDARNGYVFLDGRIGIDGAMLLLSTENGVAHVTEHGDGFHIDVFPSHAPRGKRHPGYFIAWKLENALRVGARMLEFIGKGYEIG